MNKKVFKKEIFNFIKVLSTVLIASAIGLELWNLYAKLTTTAIPHSLTIIFGIERFAITIHLIEGLVAGAYAPSKNKIPIKTGIYTFFVGTVGLLELLDRDD